MNHPWEDHYRVRSYETGSQGRLKFVTLCDWLQESGWKNAEYMGLGHTYLSSKNLAWVLSRMYVRLVELPRWGEAVKLLTWPSGRDKLFCYRDFRILNADEVVIAEATTTWFVIDMLKRRPQRTDSYFPEGVPEPLASVLPDRLKKLESPTTAVEVGSWPVRYRDLDMNLHVNNVRYIERIIDSFPADFQQEHYLQEFEINYLAEALDGDYISAFVDKAVGEDTLEYSHRLSRRKDELDLCKARTVWR
ncbi:MAG: acyl-ACP thioesterase domain-containing protein [Calditrichota bacterium]